MIIGSRSTVGGCKMVMFLSRIFGSIFIGICLSSFVTILTMLFLSIRNLPNILATLQRFIRSLFRGSFWLYRAILNPVRAWLFHHTSFDVFQPVTRTIFAICLSLIIGAGLFALFSWHIPNWYLVVLGVHGFFVGFAWENILRSDDFQMGVNLE